MVILLKNIARFTIIDEEDFELISPYRWHGVRNQTTTDWYARGSCKGKQSILMHRLILSPFEDMMIDHINHNSLDNKKSNLRIVTNSINQHNRREYQNYGIIKYKDRFRVKIMIDKKVHYLGVFDTQNEAKTAYVEAKEILLVYGNDVLISNIAATKVDGRRKADKW